MSAESPDAAREIALPVLLGDAAEDAEIGIAVYADDGKYVAVNKHACELLGYERSEVLARDVADFSVGEVDRGALETPIRREGVRLVRRKDGSTVPVAFVAVPTRIARLSFYFSAFWQLADDDPRLRS